MTVSDRGRKRPSPVGRALGNTGATRHPKTSPDRRQQPTFKRSSDLGVQRSSSISGDLSFALAER